MEESFLSNKNLQDFINNLKINEEQKKFLLNELPSMDRQERCDLLDALEKVYILNEEEKVAVEKIKNYT